VYGTRVYGTRVYGTRVYGTRVYGTRLYGTRLYGTLISLSTSLPCSPTSPSPFIHTPPYLQDYKVKELVSMKEARNVRDDMSKEGRLDAARRLLQVRRRNQSDL